MLPALQPCNPAARNAWTAPSTFAPGRPVGPRPPPYPSQRLLPAAAAALVVRRCGWRRVDTAYNAQWLAIEERPVEELRWAHSQTFWASADCLLWAFELCRFACLAPPSGLEVCVAGVVYAGLYASRYQEVPNLPEHYRVTFYASCGWAFYSFASLVHVMAGGVGAAEALHGAASAVFVGSCWHFYSYHWGRMYRHWQEGRFRPWFALGIAGLTGVHALSLGHIFKVLDDPLWWPTVLSIYPEEWHFVADIRFAELFLTAAALFLVICHLRGVLTGSKNAAAVFVGTVFAPAGGLVLETLFLKASAWQHYFMNGPKYF